MKNIQEFQKNFDCLKNFQKFNSQMFSIISFRLLNIHSNIFAMVNGKDLGKSKAKQQKSIKRNKERNKENDF